MGLEGWLPSFVCSAYPHLQPVTIVLIVDVKPTTRKRHTVDADSHVEAAARLQPPSSVGGLCESSPCVTLRREGHIKIIPHVIIDGQRGRPSIWKVIRWDCNQMSAINETLSDGAVGWEQSKDVGIVAPEEHLA